MMWVVSFEMLRRKLLYFVNVFTYMIVNDTDSRNHMITNMLTPTTTYTTIR